MNNEQNEGLKREIGILDVAVNVVNISIASGIFLLPAIVAGILGNASFMAYILCGSIFLLIALCYAEASSRITITGGEMSVNISGEMKNPNRTAYQQIYRLYA